MISLLARSGYQAFIIIPSRIRASVEHTERSSNILVLIELLATEVEACCVIIFFFLGLRFFPLVLLLQTFFFKKKEIRVVIQPPSQKKAQGYSFFSSSLFLLFPIPLSPSPILCFLFGQVLPVMVITGLLHASVSLEKKLVMRESSEVKGPYCDVSVKSPPPKKNVVLLFS